MRCFVVWVGGVEAELVSRVSFFCGVSYGGFFFRVFVGVVDGFGVLWLGGGGDLGCLWYGFGDILHTGRLQGCVFGS